MRVGWGWLAGLLTGATLGATWGFLGNDYEPGDSAIGTGLMGAALGLFVGITSDVVRFARKH
ncbi:MULTISPECIES: hypothetical protein [Actinomadura]|uniref:hypothetical protein n=1 Tax=Actinomadura TaxID=1988 RepID=UPI00047CA714|nr:MULTISPECIES: hypothetical protein [Actinomadura]RSN41069.1 hypothetical protein DMH08_39080 [Actinomadura sp. WAC 06369]